MNFTRDYHDDLDGNFLACKPGDVAKGLHTFCKGLSLVGAWNLFNGIWFLYLVYIKRQHRKMLERKTQVKNTEVLTYLEKMFLSGSFAKTFGSLVFILNGGGTMYPTTRTRGQIGDMAGAICFAVLWYMSLLQYRGAIYFKSLIPQPRGAIRHAKQPTNQFHLPSLSTIFDIMQSWFAPVIALILWVLLRVGVYTRGRYYFLVYSVHGLCGLRTFVATVSQRLATLKHVARMVYAKGGTREEIQRRRSFLTKELIILVINLFFVLFLSVMLPISMVLFGSTFDSRQMAIHAVVMLIPMEIMTSLANLHAHANFYKNKLKSSLKCSKKKTKNGTSKVNPSSVPKGMSLLEGSSIIGQSEV